MTGRYGADTCDVYMGRQWKRVGGSWVSFDQFCTNKAGSCSRNHELRGGAIPQHHVERDILAAIDDAAGRKFGDPLRRLG